MLHSRPPQVKLKELNKKGSKSPRETALEAGLRLWAEVDLDAVTTNVRALKHQAEPSHLLAVVKSNAFGHGSVPVARAAIEAGAWGLGVISLEEGEELRRAGIDGPVLILGSCATVLARRIVANDLRATVGSIEMGEALAAAAREQGKQAYIHLKVETGLNRFGVVPEDAVGLAEAMRNTPELVVEGLSTHLASVDEGDKTFTFKQFETFRKCADLLPWIPLHHVASTGALLDVPELKLGLARSGIGVYGYYPSDEVSRSVPLKPVLSLRSRLARVAEVAPGDSVGYGRTWVAQRASKIGLVLAGYGDGIRRSLSSKGVALVRGHRVPYAGRIAMDMFMVDVTDVPGAQVDDEVTLIGTQGDETVDAHEMAANAATISYEVLAGLTQRVTRLFIRGGCVVASQDLSGYREGFPD
jgi:alanine racemase